MRISGEDSGSENGKSKQPISARGGGQWFRVGSIPVGPGGSTNAGDTGGEGHPKEQAGPSKGGYEEKNRLRG